jgi:hypothetical protein
MSRDVTNHSANHDDATSHQHFLDKEAKKIRDAVDWKAVPAINREIGTKLSDGVSAKVPGFSIQFIDGQPKIVDGKEYTKGLLTMAKQRRKYVRKRERNDKTTYESGEFSKSGAVSLVITTPPWAQAAFNRLSDEEQVNLTLRIAKRISKAVYGVSGRPTWGMGVHWDTEAVRHFHVHVPKSAEPSETRAGLVYDKKTFLTAGPFLVGCSRIEKRFPNLLSKQKKEMADRALGRKRKEHLVDVRATLEVDNEIEEYFLEKGGVFLREYENDCRRYCKRKKKSQEEEQYKPLMKASLESFNETGIWPIFYKFMKLCMWRMIPKSLRKPIQMSIRLFQLIKKDDDSNGDGTFDTAGDGTLEMPSLSNKVRKILLANIELSRELGAKKQKLPGNIG